MSTSEHLFFPKRLRRLNYLARIIILEVCLWLLYTARPPGDPSAAVVRLLIICIVGLALLIYGLFFVMLPRLADAGMSSWWVLLGLFPYLGLLFQLFLAFIPSNHHDVSEQT